MDFKQARGLPEKLVVIGNGMAGCRAVEELLARDPARYSITIFGAEPRVNYNRIMLSPVLAGEKSFAEIVLNTAEWYAENGIDLVAGDPVDHIDRAAQTVAARSGRVEPYDRLLIATGRTRSSSRCRAETCPAWSPFATSTTSTRCSPRRRAAGKRW